MQDPPEGHPFVPFFAGKVTSIPRKGAPATEERRYVIQDPWNDLERLTYQQQWNTINGVLEDGTPTTANEDRSEFILGIDLNGNPQNNDAAIIDVLNWAIGCMGASPSFQIGSILAGGSAPVPYKEMRDLPCSEVIKELIRLTPDAVTWFDYTTSPPTFNVTRRGACAQLNLPFTGIVEDIDLSPRYDLVRAGIVIRYISITTVDGLPTTLTTIDAAPDGVSDKGFDVLVSTTRLDPGSETFQKQKIKIQVIPQAGGAWESSADPEGGPANDPVIQFWLNRIGWLNDPDQSGGGVDSWADQYVITNVWGVYNPGQGDDDGSGEVAVDPAKYPNALLEGSFHDWMGVYYAACTFTCLIKYSYPDDESAYSTQDWDAVKIFGPDEEADDGSHFSPTIELSCPITATSAVTKTYYSSQGYESPEPAPAGFAAVLYAALNVLHYEGTYTVVQPEAQTGNTLGCVLNIGGGLAEWATMKALVQEIEDDLDAGRTTWHTGPPGHLTVQDLMEQLRYMRTRTASSHISERKTGSPGNSFIEGPDLMPAQGGSGPPGGTGEDFPWVGQEIDPDAGEDEDNPPYDVVLGYGQSSFADALGGGRNATGPPSPLSKFEIDVGNTGDGFDDGQWASNQPGIKNAFSLISGDDTDDNDQLLIGRVTQATAAPSSSPPTMTPAAATRLPPCYSPRVLMAALPPMTPSLNSPSMGMMAARR